VGLELMIKYITDVIGKLKNMYFLYKYGKHLQRRIEKNDFGRHPEY
jgi:hypothetical protein